jgi:hypothetical protein
VRPPATAAAKIPTKSLTLLPQIAAEAAKSRILLLSPAGVLRCGDRSPENHTLPGVSCGFRANDHRIARMVDRFFRDVDIEPRRGPRP